MQIRIFTKICELFKSPNINWGVYLAGLFHSPSRGPLWWEFPRYFGIAILLLVLGSSPEHSPQTAFISQHYLLLSTIALLIITANLVYFSLNERRLIFEHIKDKHLAHSEERKKFEEEKRFEGKKNILRDTAFKVATYIFLLWVTIGLDYLSLRILVAAVIIDLIALIAILLLARKMPLGRNALSLYDCYEINAECSEHALQGKEGSTIMKHSDRR